LISASRAAVCAAASLAAAIKLASCVMAMAAGESGEMPRARAMSALALSAAAAVCAPVPWAAPILAAIISGVPADEASAMN
jgi:hypothetical protein